MHKRPLHVLSLISAVICIAALLLVGRSFFRLDALIVPVGPRFAIQITTIDAALMLAHIPDARFLELNYSSLPMSEMRPLYRDRFWPMITGIRWLAIGWADFTVSRVVVLPLWLLPIPTAILPIRWYLLRRRVARRGFPVVAPAA